MAAVRADDIPPGLPLDRKVGPVPVAEPPAPLRLNLGAGATEIEGFTPVDHKLGSEVYPLAFDDGTVDEIRASHVLEHFSHKVVPAVLADWARALKPGGLLRIAVPDFQWIAEQYLAGAQLPIEGYVMGGHTDLDDHHGALFDTETLMDLLAEAGLLGICRWESEIDDCARQPVSLNLQGWKPPAVWPKVSAVMSVPRLTFSDNHACAERATRPFGIPVRHVQGAFWGQCLTRGFEQALAEEDPEFILAIDYDSIYTWRDVAGLLSAAMRHPDVGVIAPVQAHRRDARQLFTMRTDGGQSVSQVDRAVFAAELADVATAHFGLTLIRASALRALPLPWFKGEPSNDGRWGDGRLDDDTWFWRQCKAAGVRVCLANRVAIGHAELMVRWPDRNLGVTVQPPSDFWTDGKPEDVWR